MSFFKKLTKEFGELKANFSDDPKKDEQPTQQPPTQERDFGQQTPYGQPAPYNQGPQYGNAPSQDQSQYGASYGRPPPPPPSQSSGPQLPPGWIMQWDPASQRNYYVEQATGRTQWEPPAPPPTSFSPPPAPFSPPPAQAYGGQPYYGAPSNEASRGAWDNNYTQHQYNQGYDGAPGYNPHGAPGPYDPNMAGHVPGPGGDADRGYADASQPPKKDHSTRNMLLAGAGGLAGGALIANALDDSDSDDEHKAAAAPAPAPAPADSSSYGNPSAPPQDSYYQDESAPPAPPPADGALPTHDADGEYIEYSDRESVEEARGEVQDAQEEVAEASSESDRESAQEDLEEAQEDYQEEYEETYD